MRCSKCGAENREGARFCDNCGAKLSPTCGAENRIDAKLCGFLRRYTRRCGRRGFGSKRRAPILVVETDAPEHTEGERKTVTAVFADIKGSMDLIEDLDPRKRAPPSIQP